MKPQTRLNPRSILLYALQGGALGLLAMFLVLYFTLDDATIEALSVFSWPLLLLVFPMVFMAWFCNSARVYLLSRSLGYPLTFRQCISISLSFEFGVAATPAGVGGAIIRLALLKRAGIPLAHGTSMLTIDVAVDTLFFIILLPFAIWAIYTHQTRMPALEQMDLTNLLIYTSCFFLLIGVVIGLVQSGLLIRLIRYIACWSMARRYRLPARLRWYEWRFIKEFIKVREGILHLYKVRPWVLLLNFVLASLQWTCRYGILPILAYLLDAPSNPFLLFIIQGLLFTLSLMVVIPGGGGSVEVLMSFIMQGLMPKHMVGVTVALWRFFTYALYLIGGGVVFFYTLAHLKHIFPKGGEAPEELDLAEEVNDVLDEESPLLPQPQEDRA